MNQKVLEIFFDDSSKWGQEANAKSSFFQFAFWWYHSNMQLSSKCCYYVGVNETIGAREFSGWFFKMRTRSKWKLIELFTSTDLLRLLIWYCCRLWMMKQKYIHHFEQILKVSSIKDPCSFMILDIVEKELVQNIWRFWRDSIAE